MAANDKTSEEAKSDESLTKIGKLRNELVRLRSLFESSFDELHSTVLKEIRSPVTYIGPHSDYPQKYIQENGLPRFHKLGFYDDKCPRDYVGFVKPKGFLAAVLMGNKEEQKYKFPQRDDFKEYLAGSQMAKRRFSSDNKTVKFPEYRIDAAINSAVDKYLHRHGVDAAIETKARDAILRPLLKGLLVNPYQVSLMIPIALTKFDFERFRLTETSYIARIPEKLQLSRARMGTLGSGASEQVVHAATHAFVSTGWTLDVDDIGEVPRSLSMTSDNAFDTVDTFLGALRLATGIKTGYAQVLWVPRGWALDYYCDLPPVFGATVRKYPGEFDSYGWSEECPTVSFEDLSSVQQVYEQMNASDSEAIRLATRRLSSCLTRSDPADAVLDGTIGLELLLGDDKNQSLSYKLRLRAAALSWLDDGAESASEIADKVKRVYAARSGIVHGSKPKRKKDAADKNARAHEEDRQLAAELLRFVLRIQLANPAYLDPSKIDSELILRGLSEAENSDESKG